MSDFDERYPNARTMSGKAHWPRGVHTISLQGVDYLGVDDDGQLYWDGRKIKVANPIELTSSQSFIAFVAAASAFSLALFDALRFFGYGHGP